MVESFSKWEILRTNAEERLESALILYSNNLFSAAYENAFFAMEIGFKAVMLKNDPEVEKSKRGHPWFSHDLGIILDADKLLDRALRLGCQEEYILLRQCCWDSSEWKPWKRYFYRADREISELYLKLAEGLVKWMLLHLLKP